MTQRQQYRYFIRFRGDVYALGPTSYGFTNEHTAREYLRRLWNLRTLRHIEVWKANPSEYGRGVTYKGQGRA